MPHMPRYLMLMILLFYRTILSCLETEKCVKFYFTMYILKTPRAAKTAVWLISQQLCSDSSLGWSLNQDTLISLHLNTFTWKIIHVSKILRQELLNLKTHRLAADLSPLASVCEQLCTWICVLRCEEYSAADKFWTFHFLHQLVQQQFDPCFGHLCLSPMN